MQLKAVKIKSIKSVGKQHTYDLTVDDNHNFFLSNDILAHNCLDCQSPCLDEDTEIKVKRNKKWINLPIKELNKNEIVQSYNLKGNRVRDGYADIFYTGEKDCYEIELETGEKVIATPNHRFFDSDRNEIFTEHLSVGDTILVDNKIKKMLIPVKIKSIRKIKNRKVYDVSVRHYHNFLLSNNILSHNSEVRGIVSGQQDFMLLGRLPSSNDRDEATEQPYRDGFITLKMRDIIGALDPGQFVILPNGKKALYRYFLLPRTRYWEEGNNNFYNNIWTNEVDKWVSYTEEINKIHEEFKEDMKRIQAENRFKDNQIARLKDANKTKKEINEWPIEDDENNETDEDTDDNEDFQDNTPESKKLEDIQEIEEQEDAEDVEDVEDVEEMIEPITNDDSEQIDEPNTEPNIETEEDNENINKPTINKEYIGEGIIPEEINKEDDFDVDFEL